MKNWFIFTLICFSGFLWGQSRDDYFIESANLFLNNKNTEALDKVEEGLYKFPKDKKLEALKKKLEEQKESEKNKKEQNNKTNKNKQDERNNENNKKQEQKASGKEKNQTEEPQTNIDFRKEMYNSILESLEKEEKRTKKRLMRQMGKREYTPKEKDW
ncbi:hypothetical protein KRX57_02250 [Weeksellaceae bacterium TAE3-ERU29]|nr:hypothetical protein [Weeksellaceae bacterium TAE3-ERU29]